MGDFRSKGGYKEHSRWSYRYREHKSDGDNNDPNNDLRGDTHMFWFASCDSLLVK